MTTPRRRRWFRFSLRTFFVVIALAALPAAWIGRQAALAREWQAVLDELPFLHHPLV